MELLKALLLWVVLLQYLTAFVSAASTAEKDLTLTESQRVKLQQFMKLVIPQLEKDYMKTEVFLIKWLRAGGYDVERAQTLLLQNLDWRVQNKIDTIGEEDWSDYSETFDYNLNSVDKEGQPILYMPFGSWDVRQQAVAGNGERLKRYVYKMYEEAIQLIRDKQAKGELVTKFVYLVNLEGFNTVQQGCIQCLPVLLDTVVNYEKQWPGMIDKTVVINTPRVFQILLNAIMPLLSADTRNGLNLLDTNKQNWQKVLSEFIDEKELSWELGGTHP